MKKFNLIFLFVFVFTFGVYAQNEITGKEKESVIGSIIKANIYNGYKGEVLITVNYHEEDNIGIKGMGANEGKTYKAYFDLADKNAQKIIFYKDKNLKELEISLTGGKLKIIYDGKDITSKIKNYKKELVKYPYTFLNFIFGEYEQEYLFAPVDITLYFDVIKEEESLITVYDYKRQGYKYLVEGARVDGIYIDDNYRITCYFAGDYEMNYEWDKTFLSNISSDAWGSEGVYIKFLDKNGWAKK